MQDNYIESRWNNLDRPLILASNSPRREEILGNMGFDFSMSSPKVENEKEYLYADNITESLQKLARAKALSVSSQNRSSLVLGCDTVVMIDKSIIGKPESYSEAREMLQRLSGRAHKVYSGIALICMDLKFEKTAVACTDVFFRNISKNYIEDYLNSEDYSDKAGAYAIQGKAMIFVDKINGCFFNVMGLPISETIGIYKAYTEFRKGLE